MDWNQRSRRRRPGQAAAPVSQLRASALLALASQPASLELLTSQPLAFALMTSEPLALELLT